MTYGQRYSPRDISRRKRTNPSPQLGTGSVGTESVPPQRGRRAPARGRVGRGAYREVRARPRPTTPSRRRGGAGWGHGPADGPAGRGGGREGEGGALGGGGEGSIDGGVSRSGAASSLKRCACAVRRPRFFREISRGKKDKIFGDSDQILLCSRRNSAKNEEKNDTFRKNKNTCVVRCRISMARFSFEFPKVHSGPACQ